MKTLRNECTGDTLLIQIQISEADVCLEARVGRRCLKEIIRNITTNREEIAWIERLLALDDQIAEVRALARTLAEDYSSKFVKDDVIEPRLGGVLEQLETLKASLERERSQGLSGGFKTFYPHPARPTYRGPATNQDESSGASTEADLIGDTRSSSLPDQCEARRR